jgi:hypothetical protein
MSNEDSVRLSLAGNTRGEEFEEEYENQTMSVLCLDV